jgi:hypothetical protein
MDNSGIRRHDELFDFLVSRSGGRKTEIRDKRGSES